MLSKTKKVITTSHPMPCSVVSYKLLCIKEQKLEYFYYYLKRQLGGGMEIKMEEILKRILENMGMETDFRKDTKLEDLGIDSLKLLELIVELEESLNFTFEQEDFEMDNFLTVETLLNTLHKHVEQVEFGCNAIKLRPVIMEHFVVVNDRVLGY